MCEPDASSEGVLWDLQESFQKQRWQQRQQLSGSSFGELYESVCNSIRSNSKLDDIMEAFERCRSDQDRVSLMLEMPELTELKISARTSGKYPEEAASCEELYNLLVVSESNAAKAYDVIQRAILLTPTHDNNALARRYTKRAWSLLLQEQFDDAFTDARRALGLSTSPGLLWNAHEILGHCHARLKLYKDSEANFTKALEGLRKSQKTNQEKAVVASRIAAVFKMVKEENRPKNRSKQSARKQEESKKSNLSKKPNNDKDSDDVSCMVQKSSKPVLPRLDFGKHLKLDSASGALTVVNVEGKGRSVIANRDIKPGSILMVDQPYACVLNADQLTERCIQCFRRVCTGVPCCTCSVVQYCSEDCQREGASQHRLECQVMTELYDTSLGKMAPLVFRILQNVTWPRLQKSKEKLLNELSKEQTKDRNEILSCIFDEGDQQKWCWDGHYSPKEYITTFYLVTNTSKRTFGDIFKRTLSAIYITQLLQISGFFRGSVGPVQQNDIAFVASLALRHMQSSACNAYEISELQMHGNIIENHKSIEIGGAIYPTISLTNHSCFPNVARYNIGTSGVLRSTRLIPKGSEVLDNYGYYYHSMPIVERRDALRAQYKFECSCNSCFENWSLYPHRRDEPIPFTCPAPRPDGSKCGEPTQYQGGRNKQCSACGDTKHFTKLINAIKVKVDEYAQALTQLHENKFDEALQNLLQQQSFFDIVAIYPAKHYTDLQELIRLCMNCQGNTHDPQSRKAKLARQIH